MKELVFLLEEASSAAMLSSLLPRLLAPGIGFRLIAFEGKQDLEKQLVGKLRAYRNQDARFIVLRDQDNHPDCRVLKQALLAKCEQSGRAAHCIVRIACHELESFYLADLAAVEAALGLKGLQAQQQNKKFRAPDRLGSPSHELKILTRQSYQKVSGSKAIGALLDVQNQRSSSFYQLLQAIHRLQDELLA